MNLHLSCRCIFWLAVVTTTSAPARAHQPTFADAWAGSQPVVKELAQVVYYRDATPHKPVSGANIYIDGQYRTTLLPGGYTVFCLKPGDHSLGALLNEPPLYPGKSERFHATLQGGVTYYLRVDEKGKTLPQQVSPVVGEQQLKHAYRQQHTLNRSRNVEPCVYDNIRQLPAHDYTLELNRIIAADFYVTDQGRELLGEKLIALRLQYPRFNRLTVLLPPLPQTDRLQLADNLRQALTEQAVPAKTIAIQYAADCVKQGERGCQTANGIITLRPANEP